MYLTTHLRKAVLASATLALLALLVPATASAEDGAGPAPARPAVPVPAQPRPAAEDLAVVVPHYANATCPIMGKPSSKRLFVNVPEGRIYICCPPCVKKIRQDPAGSYRAAYPIVKAVGNKACPVTGKVLKEGHPYVELQGFKIGVFDAAAQVAARKQAQVTLVKVHVKDAKDLKNTKCPVTGGAVKSGVLCLIGKNIVHISSYRVVTTIRRDPAGALRKARASAAR